MDAKAGNRRRRSRIGIVILPAIFGTSASFWWKVWSLRLRGCKVIPVDIYEGQSFRRPFFLSLVRDNTKIQRLAAAFDDGIVQGNILRSVVALRKECDTVFAFAYGYGAHPVLKLFPRDDTLFDGLVLWHPHWILPEGNLKQDSSPDPLDVSISVLQFFGEDDEYAFGKRVAREFAAFSHIETVLLPGTGHVFAECMVQYCFPNPYWRPKASRTAWKRALEWMDRKD